MVTFEISTAEEALLKKYQLAVFNGRIIYDAQGPITDEVVQEIETKIAGSIPQELLELWKISFGGALDYDVFADFNGNLQPLSITELFYPESNHYGGLFYWINHEQSLLDDGIEGEQEGAAPKINCLPFAGFDYAERTYIITQSDEEYPLGTVIHWSQGLPGAWIGRLHEDSVASVAPGIIQFFDQLFYAKDPFESAQDYRSGRDIIDALEPLADEGRVGKNLQEKLYALLRRSVFNWRDTHKKDGLIGNAIYETIAIENILKDADIDNLKMLVKSGLDINKRRRGLANIIDMAARLSSWKCFDWLLEKNSDLAMTLEFGSRKLDFERAQRLYHKGAEITAYAAQEFRRRGKKFKWFLSK